MASIHEHTARANKAARLVAVLTAHGASAAQAAALPAEGRATTEQLAGVRPASEATWALVVRDMEDAERVAARKAMLLVLDESRVA